MKVIYQYQFNHWNLIEFNCCQLLIASSIFLSDLCGDGVTVTEKLNSLSKVWSHFRLQHPLPSSHLHAQCWKSSGKYQNQPNNDNEMKNVDWWIINMHWFCLIHKYMMKNLLFYSHHSREGRHCMICLIETY